MGWYDVFKVAADAVEKLKDAKANSAMAGLQMEMAKLAQENAELREALLALRGTARLRGMMRFKDNAYWQDEKGVIQGPFCPKCWPADDKAVRLVTNGPHEWKCPVCGTYAVMPGSRGSQQDDDFDTPREPIR